MESSEAFWDLLERGGNAIGEIPRDRWDVEAYYDADPAAPGKMYTRHGGFVRDIDQFDAAFFRITPREAADLDPQQRLLLEVAWESQEHAGLAPASLHGSETGVFIGLSSDDHATWQHHGNGLADINAYQTLGTEQRGGSRMCWGCTAPSCSSIPRAHRRSSPSIKRASRCWPASASWHWRGA